MAKRILMGLLLIGLLLAAMSAPAQEGKQRIAFQRSLPLAPSDIVVMYLDGTTYQDLLQHKDITGRRVTPALSPDGQTLCFAAQVGERFQLFIWRLDERNMAIGNPIQLTKDDTADAKFPSWSPDGTQLAYLSTDEKGKTSLRVIKQDGTDQKVLIDVNYNSATPSWGNAGQWLLFVDKIGNHPGLRQIPATGGMVQDIRPQSTITAASYSPDGTKIAALIRRPDGLSDLWVLTPPGITGNTVCAKISGGRDVAWLDGQTIVFSATKVGDKAGSAFWKVNTQSKDTSGLTGYFNPKEISFFSVQNVNMQAEPLTVADINNAAGPGAGMSRERVPQGPVTIIRPFADTTVRGILPIQIIAQKQVTSIVVRINDQFIYTAEARPGADDVTRFIYNWNTQQLIDLEPFRGSGLPEFYQEPRANNTGPKKPQLLRYPDGSYTLTVQALERDNEEIDRLIGKDSIKVTVQNTIPNNELPGNILLRYQYREVDPYEEFDLYGEGTLHGPDLLSISTLNSKFNARIRRALVDTRQNGNYDLRTTLRLFSRNDVYPLTFGSNRVEGLPELHVSALYSMSPSGELAVVPQRLKKLYLPLAQIGLTFPTTPIQVGSSFGSSWKGQMWVVNDLLGREGMQVQVDNVAEGLEWIGNRKTIRIRSDIIKDNFNTLQNVQLPLQPTTLVPGNFDSMRPPQQSGLKVKEAEGKRYTWFDYEHNQIVRVEDFILYTFPLANVPSSQPTYGPASRPGAVMPGGSPPGTTPSGGYAPLPGAGGGGDVPSSRLGPGGYAPMPGGNQPGGYAPMPGGDVPSSRLAPGAYAPPGTAPGGYAPMPGGAAPGGYAPMPGGTAPGGYAPMPGGNAPAGDAGDVPPSRLGPGANQPGVYQPGVYQPGIYPPGVNPPPTTGTPPAGGPGSITSAPKPRTGNGYYLVRWSYLIPQDEPITE